MATATKKRKKIAGPPNDLSRREKTRKAEKCQLCLTKVPLKEQFTVQNDLENLKVVVKKNAARKGAEKMSHYCGTCKDERVKLKTAWMQRTHGEGAAKKVAPKTAKPKASKTVRKAKAKPAAKKKVAAKPKAKATKPASKPKPRPSKRAAKKPARAAAAAKEVAGDAEPF